MEKTLRVLLVPFWMLINASIANAECKLTKACNPYQSCGYIWKPVAEHVGKPVVVTLPIGDAKKVQVLDDNKAKIKTFRFRSVGVAGDAWQDYQTTAKQYQKKYKKGIYVRVFRNKGCNDYFVKNPCKRSDGQNRAGNCE